MKTASKSVLLFGATGTIGRATALALTQAGHHVTCVVRPSADATLLPDTVKIWHADVTALGAMPAADAIVSCLASRTGDPADAWAIDHGAHVSILNAAKAAGVGQFVLLSAICVQKPLLEFQKAKLAFEDALTNSELTYSIVRPTAFFKSLSGQIERVKSGKPFLLFGDGKMTACKPISDRDLGRYLTLCLTDPALQNRILPVGGPGDAITPRAQGQMIFDLLGKDPKFKSVPLGVMDAIIKGLSIGGAVVPALKRKAQFARIGRYYASESMLVWDGARYDADATPSFGQDTLRDHYAAMIDGNVAADLGDHAVF
ncbi:NAD(P)H-binding protein [Octadecabacter sp. G9-8]|uniref:Divinyl chlorophyllide a 8-vinyl-reductase, chloroplastic n=1 Tax=Octadecabacter dasysiphoniae TaxID=2909341 RepID=A0ABS9CZ75_9RHOB|nr:NAD(P)H-binding protein [Octadecabacter dasysiphoniae]MCF2871695.1 NAD(P)H-binding protein [Octadecabacter dasysiphoniae]